MADPLVETVKECIVKYKVRDIVPSIQAALGAGIPAITILQEGMVAGMTEVGEGFKNNTVFMPQMLVAAKAMQAGLVILKPKLAEGGTSGPGGKAIVCSVLGDVHDIGKNLVTVMLQGQGLEVRDLGADVSTERIMAALDEDPEVRIAALSSSMTPTREPLRESVAAINGRANRDQIAVLIGGATMDQVFCDEIGADMYTSNAAACASRATQVLSGEMDFKAICEDSRATALRDLAAKEHKDVVEEKKEDGPAVTPRHLQKNLTRIAREANDRTWIDRKPLSQKDNFRETLKHGKGHPDRFVDQYEYMNIIFDPIFMAAMGFGEPPDANGYHINGWGIVEYTPPGAAGSHPLNDPEHRVIKDITHWQDYVKAPPLQFPEEAWAQTKDMYKQVKDKNDQFTATFFAPGLFEKSHELFDMKEALEAYYQEPEYMHELLDYFVEYELNALEELFRNVETEVLFHHDDWGTALNSFLDPVTHRTFFCDRYKKIYKKFKELGGEYIVHHSDSYAANLVQIDIDAGTDVWQGCIVANDVPALIDQYGDRFVFMGGIDEAVLDDPASTEKSAREYAAKCIDDLGSISIIPCQTRGLGMTIIPERYGQVSQVIAEKSKEYF